MKVISQYEVNKLHAGPKAKVDIERILKKEYKASIRTLKIKDNIHLKKNLFFFRIRKLIFVLLNKYINDITIFQLPFNKSCKLNIKSRKCIGLIHDIDGIRDLNDDLLVKEIELYNKFDVIISHNSIMTEFLKEKGLNKPIIDLELFDYILPEKNSKKINLNNINNNIVFAGNFEKSLFLSELDEKKMNFEMNLYGVGKFNKDNKKFKYFGSFLPDELPLLMEGDLGLVWDGGIDNEKVENNYLNYTKYNNPHKLSCYIAAGLPVIVWEKAACSKFVKENNIGYVISNIYDINNLDFSDYDEKIKNVKKIQKKVTTGYYTINAVKKALRIIGEN